MFPFDDSMPATPAACIDELERIERLKGELCAAQARLTARLDEADSTVSPRSSDRSLAAQVGLARHESPSRGRRLLHLGRDLVDHHPEVLALLEAGDLNEHRAELICRETRDLGPTTRRAADRDIATRLREALTRREGLGDRDLTDLARRTAYRLDPTAAQRRHARAHAQRHVGLRTHGDGTATVAGRIPLHQAAAIMASLGERTATLRATGCDTRSRDQVKADLFVERLTGQTTATAVPVRINLLVPAETLLADGDEPADVPGYGPVPAPIARALVHASPEQATQVRRLFTDTDRLVAMESVAPLFTGLLRQYLALRDRRCRTPWCDAPIAHTDHVRRRADRGPTSAHNAQGLCESCNLTKEEPGWHHDVVSTDVLQPHTVRITTPTGHQHHSRAPAPPGTDPRDHYTQTRPGLWTLIA